MYSAQGKLLLIGLLVVPVVPHTDKKMNVQGSLDAIDLNAINIEATYVGPKLDNGTITLQFMENLINFYNETLYQDETNSLHEKFVLMILKQSRDHFKTQPSLLEIELKAAENITICGDIHGKLEDLLHIFDINGFPSSSNRYLFNGNFINRRPESIETALILFGFTLLYPKTFFINRGNHEDILQTKEKGCLMEESGRKYPANQNILHGFWEVFQWLPLACLIRNDDSKKSKGSKRDSNFNRPLAWGKRIYHRLIGRPKPRVGAFAPAFRRVLVVHAGLFSRSGVTLDDIQRIKRGCDASDVGRKSLMFDMLWSDPGEKDGRHQNIHGFSFIEFGPNVSESFCIRNKIDYIIRSHTPVPMGYHVEHNGRIVTVFSTTDYHNDNRGAIVTIRAPELKPEFATYILRYEYKAAECVWFNETGISIDKYSTISVQKTTDSPLL